MKTRARGLSLVPLVFSACAKARTAARESAHKAGCRHISLEGQSFHTASPHSARSRYSDERLLRAHSRHADFSLRALAAESILQMHGIP